MLIASRRRNENRSTLVIIAIRDSMPRAALGRPSAARARIPLSREYCRL